MAIINDRVPEVKLMLGNRTDLTTRIIGWLAKAYVDMGSSIDFDELEVDNTLVLAGSTDVVAGGIIPLPDDARAINGVTVYTSSNSPIPLDPTDMKRIRAMRFRPVATIPGAYVIHGGNIVFGPVPTNDVTVVLDYWQKPAVDPGDGTTPLLLPDDWLEILDYMAALRGHVALLERDKAQEIQALLYGYTLQTNGKMVPGLIKEKLTRKQAQARNSEFGITPRMR